MDNNFYCRTLKTDKKIRSAVTKVHGKEKLTINEKLHLNPTHWHTRNSRTFKPSTHFGHEEIPQRARSSMGLKNLLSLLLSRPTTDSRLDAISIRRLKQPAARQPALCPFASRFPPVCSASLPRLSSTSPSHHVSPSPTSRRWPKSELRWHSGSQQSLARGGQIPRCAQSLPCPRFRACVSNAETCAGFARG